MSRTKKLALIYLSAILVWTVLAFTLVPYIIRDAYEGTSLPILNTIISGRGLHSLDRYHTLWQQAFVKSLLVFLVLPLPFIIARWGTAFFNRFVGPATPEALGAIRAWVFLILLVNVLWEDLPSVAKLPAQLRIDIGVMRILHVHPALETLYSSAAALVALKVLTCVFVACAAVGLRTRWTVPIAAVLVLVYGGILREYSHFYHTCMVPAYLAVALSFLPCGDGLSVDRYLGRNRASARSSAVYGWSRYVCWMLIAGSYASAGLSKIGNGGFLWWHGMNLKRIIVADTLDPMQFEWGLERLIADLPVWFYSIVGLFGLIVELSSVSVLFSRRARRVWPLLAIGMHLGILVFQGVFFFDLIMIQAVFYNWRKVLTFVKVKGSRIVTATAGVIAPVGHDAMHRRWTRGCACLALTFAVVWALRIEQYPLTAWQMYADLGLITTVKYTKVIAIHADGHKTEARPDRWIRAMTDTRYRDMFIKKPKDLRAFLAAARREANANVDSPNDSVTALSVETWKWDWQNDADSPTYGTLESVLTEPEP